MTLAHSRILVTGAGGMVGGYVPRVFPDADLVLTDVLPGLTPLDVTNADDVMALVGDVKPDVVLHLAAATDVDRCQLEPDWAFRSNAAATQHVALACRRHDAIMVYVSTGGVFFGDKETPYTEDDEPRPANVYGEAKLQGESFVTAALTRYIIARAGWMIGGGPRDKKFVGKMLRLISDGRADLKAVGDKFGSPTYSADLLNGIRNLLARDRFGLFHMANQGMCSRYDVALELRDILGRPDVDVASVSSDLFPLPAPRARSEALLNLRLEQAGLNTMPPWREALRRYVTEELMPL